MTDEYIIAHRILREGDFLFPTSEFRTWQLRLEADDVFEAAELSSRTHLRRISVTRTATTTLWRIFMVTVFIHIAPKQHGTPKCTCSNLVNRDFW